MGFPALRVLDHPLTPCTSQRWRERVVEPTPGRFSKAAGRATAEVGWRDARGPPGDSELHDRGLDTIHREQWLCDDGLVLVPISRQCA
jgi:hypothetical protein